MVLQSHGISRFSEQESKQERQFHFLKIDPDGGLTFNMVTRDLFNQREHELLGEVFTGYRPRWKQKDIEGIILDEKGNINLIEKTDLRTFPDLHAVHHAIIPGTNLERKTIDKQQLIQFTDQFIALNGANKRLNEALIFLKEQEEGPVLLTSLQHCFKAKDNSNLTLGYVDAFVNEFGYFLKTRSRNKESTARNFAALVDVHAVEEGDNLLFWANKKMGDTQGKFAKGNAIRRLVPWQNTDLVFDRLLDTMNVDFVRVGAPTVLPFPFKMLREYQRNGWEGRRWIELGAIQL